MTADGESERQGERKYRTNSNRFPRRTDNCDMTGGRGDPPVTTGDGKVVGRVSTVRLQGHRT